jgi:DNA polymerase-3 subunit epsilon/CBS domain-containing protein
MRWLSSVWRHPRGGPDLATLAARFVAVDLETTGLDPRRDAIVALAAIPFVEREPQPGLVTLVQPGRAIPPASTAIHGITDEMVAAAPPVRPALGALEDALGGDVLVGHGIEFDLAMIGRARRTHRLPPLRNRALDTMRLALALHRDLTDPGLDAVAARLGVPVNGRHTARGDAIAAGRILLALLPGLSAHGLRTLPELLWFQDSVHPGHDRR